MTNSPSNSGKRDTVQLAVAVGLVLLGAIARLAGHYHWLPIPPNVAPVSAMALFGGAYLGRRWGFLVPVGLMLISDVLIGFDRWPVEVAIYSCFLVSGWLGSWWMHRRGVGRLAGVTLLSSTLFFVVTNAVVWAFTAWYPHTVAGLTACFVAALPFFRNTVIGDVGYTAVFFGLSALGLVYWRYRISGAQRFRAHA